MSSFYTPALLISDYYDSLINQLDIYTEERIKELKEKGLSLISSINVCEQDEMINKTKPTKTYGVETWNNPYESQKYTIDRMKFTLTSDLTQIEDYFNEVRQKAIDEIRKVQEENLGFYNFNKNKFKVDRENLTDEKLEELKKNLFANRYCFLLNIEMLDMSNPNRTSRIDKSSLFKLHTVITDFYLSKSDIENILIPVNKKSSNVPIVINKRFLLANQVRKYVKDLCHSHANGCEVIQVNQKTLFEIDYIEVNCLTYSTFDETDFRFDIDLSAIKYLGLSSEKTIISDLSAFANLEYLKLQYTVLIGRPFISLNKLIKLEIICCDLGRFDFDSLNSLTSLQVLNIKINRAPQNPSCPVLCSFEIDLCKLINLKWLNLKSINQVGFNLILNGDLNRLTKLKLKRQGMDFSKRFELPELKCLHISEYNYSQQINHQWFYGMDNLIELNLIYTYLKDINFIDTDRLGNLEILCMTGNEIRILRKGAFSKLKRLKSLKFDENNEILELVPGTFDGLECLETLDISRNEFFKQSICETVFDGLISLKCLFFYDNKKCDLSYLKRNGLVVYT